MSGRKHPHIPIEQWGKDHWSLLAYVETRCVDYNGALDLRRMTVNPNLYRRAYRLRFEQFGGHVGEKGAQWTGKHITRLASGFEAPAGHCDRAILDDLAGEGLVIIHDEDLVEMTPLGSRVGGELRAAKAGGINYAEFSSDAMKAGAA